MKIDTLEVAGIAPALKGMRNPMNSWELSDTVDVICMLNDGCDGCRFDEKQSECLYYSDIIGEKDLILAQKLIKAGGEHSKFMRQIQVWVDIEAPRYFWSEFDTYHFNSKNSCSTMHKLFQKDRIISIDDFEIDECLKMKYKSGYSDFDSSSHSIFLDSIHQAILSLNQLQKAYFTSGTNKTELLVLAKRILPESFLQLRTVNTNYAELRNMYMQRKNHRLEEWAVTFCEWVESLPYAKELILYGLEK